MAAAAADGNVVGVGCVAQAARTHAAAIVNCKIRTFKNSFQHPNVFVSARSEAAAVYMEYLPATDEPPRLVQRCTMRYGAFGEWKEKDMQSRTAMRCLLLLVEFVFHLPGQPLIPRDLESAGEEEPHAALSKHEGNRGGQ